MQGHQSNHPIGVAAFCVGDLARYQLANRANMNVYAPPGSMEYYAQGSNVADSINRACAMTLENPAYKWLWLMGDDHVYPPEILLRQLDRDVPVCVAMCLNRYVPFDVTIIKNGHVKPIEELPPSGMYRLGEDETCGDAAMLIRREVLEALEPPWYDRLRSGEYGVDDQCFVARVKRAGFPVHYDLDNRIGHMTPFVMVPHVVNGEWRVRLVCGNKPVVDIQPQRGSDRRADAA